MVVSFLEIAVSSGRGCLKVLVLVCCLSVLVAVCWYELLRLPRSKACSSVGLLLPLSCSLAPTPRFPCYEGLSRGKRIDLLSTIYIQVYGLMDSKLKLSSGSDEWQRIVRLHRHFLSLYLWISFVQQIGKWIDRVYGFTLHLHLNVFHFP